MLPRDVKLAAIYHDHYADDDVNSTPYAIPLSAHTFRPLRRDLASFP